MATDAWLKMFMPELIPFVIMFIGFDVIASLSWVVIILRKILPVSKCWVLVSPLITAGIGTLLDLIPLPFNGLNAGFETFGWMLMFVCGMMERSKASFYARSASLCFLLVLKDVSPRYMFSDAHTATML